jgi:hypothetical protein
VEQY